MLFAYSGVQHILCCVFSFFFFVLCTLLPVSLDCQFLIAPSVFFNAYLDCLIKELGIANSLGEPTCTPMTLTKGEILDKHSSVLCSVGILTTYEELDRLSLFWIHKLHKCHYKHRCIAGSAKCTNLFLK